MGPAPPLYPAARSRPPSSRPGRAGKVLLSTIAENEGMMHELFGARPVPFLPSIPHLVYQYRFYANYEPTRLAEANPEIPEE